MKMQMREVIVMQPTPPSIGAPLPSARSPGTTESRAAEEGSLLLEKCRHLQVQSDGWRRGDEQMNPLRAKHTRLISSQISSEK